MCLETKLISKAYISGFIDGRDMNGKLHPYCSVMKCNIRNVAATSLLKGDKTSAEEMYH